MAYTTPLKVFQGMERIEYAEESYTNVSSGDTLDITNNYIIDGTETLTVGGVEQTDSDYTINYEDNTIDYSGTDSGDATLDYGFGPYNSQVVLDRIDSAETYIDEQTNTTYDGYNTVTDELYDGDSSQRVYTFVNRPVRSVSKVALNEPTNSSNPNYNTLTEGLGEDYVKHKDLGVKFLPEGKKPSNDPMDVQVSYDYGYSNVPGDIEELATILVIQSLAHGTVFGAMVDGRDNFDPQTVESYKDDIQRLLEHRRIMRMENMVSLAEHGNIS